MGPNSDGHTDARGGHATGASVCKMHNLVSAVASTRQYLSPFSCLVAVMLLVQLAQTRLPCSALSSSSRLTAGAVVPCEGPDVGAGALAAAAAAAGGASPTDVPACTPSRDEAEAVEAAVAREIAVGMYAAGSGGARTPAGAEADGRLPASSSWSSGVKLSTYM